MPPESTDVIVGAILIRIEQAERDLNETHSRLRESTNKIDQLSLHSEDCRMRIHEVEDGLRRSANHRSELGQKVEMLEVKLDDMKMNLTKVVEGQYDILNSNALTREQFSTVLASQDKQHALRMKYTRRVVAIGGGLLFLFSQVWLRATGNATVLDWLTRFSGIGQ